MHRPIEPASQGEEKRVSWGKAHGLSHFGSGSLQIAFPLVDQSTSRVSECRCGVDTDRLAEVGESLVEIPLV